MNHATPLFRWYFQIFLGLSRSEMSKVRWLACSLAHATSVRYPCLCSPKTIPANLYVPGLPNVVVCNPVLLISPKTQAEERYFFGQCSSCGRYIAMTAMKEAA